MSMVIINDVHIGVVRQAGTTPASASALGNYIWERFQSLVDTAVEQGMDLMILGDLFDSANVQSGELVFVFQVLNEFLDSGKKLILVAGNHDLSKNILKQSAFDVLAAVLKDRPNCQVIQCVSSDLAGVRISEHAYVIPHVPNQDLFNEELEVGLKSGAPWLFVHANYDNHFAEQSDHSLNVSAEFAERAAAKGVSIFFAHEHQARRFNNIWVAGNQFPTSVADCLGNDFKYYHTFDTEPHAHVFWKAQTDFQKIDWTDLDFVNPEAKFIRVGGQASEVQAADAQERIYRLRQSHKAFVITNAVTIEGQSLEDSVSESIESIQQLDVLQLLYSMLEPAQVEVLKKLQESQDV